MQVKKTLTGDQVDIMLKFLSECIAESGKGVTEFSRERKKSCVHTRCPYKFYTIEY